MANNKNKSNKNTTIKSNRNLIENKKIKKSAQKKSLSTKAKINENILSLAFIAVGMVILSIISLPNTGFFGNILKNIFLSLFSLYTYVLVLGLIFIGIFKLIKKEKFNYQNLNKIDIFIFFLMIMFIFIFFNIEQIRNNSVFSFDSLKNIANDGQRYTGVGIVPYIISFLFFKLIGKIGIGIFVVLSFIYLIIKYKINYLKRMFYNIRQKREIIQNENEKTRNDEANEPLIIKNKDDILNEYFSDIPDYETLQKDKKNNSNQNIKDLPKFSSREEIEEKYDFLNTKLEEMYFKNEKIDNTYSSAKEEFEDRVERLYQKYKKASSNSNELEISKKCELEKDNFNPNISINNLEKESTPNISSDDFSEIKFENLNDITQNKQDESNIACNSNENVKDIPLDLSDDKNEIETDEIMYEEDVINETQIISESGNVKSFESDVEFEDPEIMGEDLKNSSLYINNENISENIILEEKRPYVKPNINLLNDYKKIENFDRADKIRKAQLLKQTLSSFGVEANVENIAVGPTITRYEIKPKVGTKVSKITNLTEDLALALAAKSIRIEAPIPGKSFIGVEIPNDISQTVSFKEIINTCLENKEKYNIVFAMGKDISGEVVLSDITKMPHALIAGSTGSGKSVCINTIICSILYNYTPDEVKLILIDPKVVELSIYNKMPHLIIPVVTDMKKTPFALGWAVNEMEKRYALFAENKAKDINSYNQKAQIKLPRIVIIIDELADLMMVAPKDIEEAICRLAQKARACGIHLIVATQRPSVDVITGLIKANIPSRIAFAVSSQTDSRTILDSSGADKLLGKGDMLYSPIGMNKPVRIQGAFLTEEEVERITDFIEENNPVDGIVEKQEQISKQIDEIEVNSDKKSNSEDELYDEVVNFALQNEEISVSLIQRQFRVGYNRASRIVEDMEKNGIVSQSDGSKPRKVLKNI